MYNWRTFTVQSTNRMIKKVGYPVIILMTCFIFSCREQTGKVADKRVVIHPEHTAQIIPVAYRVPDSLALKQTKTGGVKPTCCVGAPSRFKLQSQTAKTVRK